MPDPARSTREDPTGPTRTWHDPPATVEQVLQHLPQAATLRQVWATLGRAGILEELYRTGAGVDTERLGELLGALDRGHSVGKTLGVCVQVATTLPLLASIAEHSATARLAHQDGLLGDRVTALAATDNVSGSDLTALESEVDIDDDGVELTGRKRWITNATTADQFLTLARTRPGRHFAHFVWVLVPATATGVSTHPASTDLFSGSGLGHIDFDHVRLSRHYLVGKPGRGLVDFANHVNTERLASGLWAMSLCRRVLVQTKDQLEQRHVDDAALWQHGAVRQRFADCLVRVQQLRALCDTFGTRVTHNRDATAAATIKTAAAQAVEHVLADCAHLQGADGFASGVQQLKAEAAVFGIGGGTTEVVRSTVADHADSVLLELRR